MSYKTFFFSILGAADLYIPVDSVIRNNELLPLASIHFFIRSNISYGLT